METRIAFASDLHGFHKRPALEGFLREERPDLLVVAGDVQDYRPYPVPTLIVAGNHESWPVIAELDSGARVVDNLRHLSDGEPESLGGATLVGLGGGYSPNPASHHPKRLRHDLLEGLRRVGADVVVSHETPIRFSDSDHDRLTCEPLRELCLRMGPAYWFSGHHHHADEEQLGPTRIISLGMWPHTWGVLRIVDGQIHEWRRHAPADRPAYDAALVGWRAEQAVEKERLLRLDRRGNAVYGI